MRAARYPAILSIVTLLASGNALAAGTLPPNHPILGTWQLDVPGTECSEIYHYFPNGTTLVTSGEEVAQSEYEIAPTPSLKGFYKITDKLVKDNGKKDCVGQITPVGDTSVRYIFFHPSGDMYLLCEDESLKSCFGPVKRVEEPGA